MTGENTLRLDMGEPLERESPADHGSAVLFGSTPPGQAMRELQPFPPELEAALDRARESGGRYMVLVYVEEPLPGESKLNRYSTKGSAWSDDWMVRAYRLFCELLLAVPSQLLPVPQAVAQPGAQAGTEPQLISPPQV